MWSAWRVMLSSGFLGPKQVLLLARVSRRANQLVAEPGSWPRHVVFDWVELHMAMARLHSATFRQKTLELAPRLYVQPLTFPRLRGLRIVELDLQACNISDVDLVHLRGLPSLMLHA